MPIERTAGDFLLRDGTPALAKSGSNFLYQSWTMLNGDTLLMTVSIPPTYAATAVKFVIEWTNLTAANGNVTLRIITVHGANAIDLNGLSTTTTDLTVAAPAQNVRKRTLHTGTTVVAADDILSVIVARNATGDTLGANLIGLISVKVIPS